MKPGLLGDNLPLYYLSYTILEHFKLCQMCERCSNNFNCIKCFGTQFQKVIMKIVLTFYSVSKLKQLHTICLKEGFEGKTKEPQYLNAFVFSLMGLSCPDMLAIILQHLKI